jgi:radical SAM superfamily enzyme YgiQ (UPF0313 family)
MINQSGINIPLGLAVLASYIREKMKNVNIEILDAHALDMSIDKIVEKAINFPWDVIGLSYLTTQANNAYEISKALKNLRKDVVIVHGGVHPTCVCHEAVEYADYVVLGEGEETFLELLKNLKNKKKLRKIRGIAFKKDGKLIKTPEREFIKNLDEIPFPAFDLLPMQRYFIQVGENIMHVVGGPRLPIMASRGCPYNCTYCVSPILWKRIVRWRSPENVVEEIEKWMEEYGINQFHFWDDNLLLNAEWVKRFCEIIIKKKLSIKWTGLTRASHINRNQELLKLMKEAGCVGIEIGVESANPKVLLAVKKGETVSEVVEAVKNQKNAGLTPLCTLMSFNVGENIDGYYLQNLFMNKYFNSRRGQYLFIGQFATTYPSTEFFFNANKEGKFLTRGWEDHHHAVINFVPNTLLKDRPKKTSKNLTLASILLATLAAFFLMYDEFPKELSKPKLAKRILRHIKIMRFYYKLCNGEYSVLDVSKKIERTFKLEEYESIRITSFITLLLALMGMIKSSGSKINVRRVDHSCLYYFLYNFLDKKIIYPITHF